MTKDINNNRDNLISMIAISEDIYRTNNRIYELLRGLMNNPQEITNIKTSINDLYEKVANLKNSDIKTPLIDEEKVIVPGPEDISPKEDPDWETLQQQHRVEAERRAKEAEAEELVVEKPPRKPRNTRRNPRKNAGKNVKGNPRENAKENAGENAKENARGRRPNKPLKNKKKLPSPDIDSI